MPVKTINAEQLAVDFRKYPIDDHGKLRFQHAKATNAVDVGDENSTFKFPPLPPGRVRILPYLSRVRVTAFGAGRTLTIGHGAYSRNPAEDLIPVDYAAFASGIDASAAGVLNFANAPFKYDLYSKAGIDLFAQVKGGSAPVGAEVEIFLAYLYE